jgi:uncharacterized membrane protein
MTLLDVTWTFALSAAPIAELRGGLPLGIARGLPPAVAYAVAVAGNVAVVPLVLLALEGAHRIARRIPWFAAVLARVDRLAAGPRKQRVIARWGPPGLILLTAIPLPGTGAWTACLVAHLLRIRRGTAWAFITVGVLIAGVLVLLGTLGILKLFEPHTT